MEKNGTIGDLEPSLAALRMEIPRGFHHKDVLTHSITVLENAISFEKNGPDIILRTAALLHDVGKPATRKFNGRAEVTFDQHEYVGARIARKILGKHGYSKKEIQKISKLISLHMRCQGSDKWTDSAVRRLMKDAENEENLQRLIVIFRSDITTKHENKKRKFLRSINILVQNMQKVKEIDKRRAMRPALNGNEIMNIFNMTPGRELGDITKFLNSDEGIHLSRDEAIQEIKKRFNK